MHNPVSRCCEHVALYLLKCISELWIKQCYCWSCSSEGYSVSTGSADTLDLTVAAGTIQDLCVESGVP